ncbi:MAG: EscU/YscU/HrcU family type III secretion system export apparatus switch protein [Epsilonproteobacteria bacterium]|nr:EscU/YscU/HrcU family type III secretion system export apparatus switch protein [Campylobacterota bacterium]
MPFTVIPVVVSVLANVAQFGFLFTTKPLEFKMDKLNPINGLKNMFSLKAFGEMVKSILKILIVIYVAYLVIKSEIISSPMLISSSLKQSFYHLLTALWNLMLYLVLLIFLLSIIDFFFQRFVYMKNQRMSKFEIKEEMKQMEGDPLIRARVKRLQREMAKRRMMEAVKTAILL